MKKIVLSLMVLVSSVFAMDIKPFVGVELGNTSTSLKLEFIQPGFDFMREGDNDGDYLGFKAGAILNEKHRVYFSYIQASVDDFGADIDYTLPAINYDYLIHFAPLSLMIGGHIGNGTTEVSTDHSDDSNVNYGFQFGILKDITQNISLELGYKVTFIDNELVENGVDADGSFQSVITHEDQTALFFGINYKF